MAWTERQLADHLKRNGTPAAPAKVDTTLPPLVLPPDIVLDLPTPISVNRLWRVAKAGHVIKSHAYKQWIKAADAMLLELGQLKGIKPITGKFTALIVVKRCNLDIDNANKGVLDFLESRNFILNDKFCEEVTARWGDAPTGCRVTVKACA